MSSLAARIQQLTPVQRDHLRRELFGDAQAPGGAAEPIAVVGIGCRFPGGVEDPESFFAALNRGYCAVSEVPDERWSLADWYDEDSNRPATTRSRWGSFLPDVASFDRGFFDISQPEAERMDPRQRLALEVSVEAVDDAGIPLESLRGSRTGVFIGSMADEYTWHQVAAPEQIDAYTAAGVSQAGLSNRISFEFDLRGPSMTIDTACSSSLVAVHQACQSLRTGESDVALAGGVSVMISPLTDVIYTKLGALSPTGRCHTFDDRADGIVRGEGVGVVVLKRLADAQRDGDRIWAVVRGSAVAQDGRTSTIAAPNGIAQAELIRRAVADAGVPGRAISYVETHGTGTSIGDPIEVEALSSVLGEGRPDDDPIVLGAVKANLGHTEAAAGIAGFIKTVLCLANRQIPPVAGFERPNPHLDLGAGPCVIPTESRPWPRQQGSGYAAVSAFGLTGTIAHVVLQEAATPPVVDPAPPTSELLVLSARAPQALTDLAARYADALAALASPTALRDFARSAASRTAHPYRLAVTAEDRTQAVARLRAAADGDSTTGVRRWEVAADRTPRVAFVFPGSGTFQSGMARRLLDAEPEFRSMMQACDEAFRKVAGGDMLDSLYGGTGQRPGVLVSSMGSFAVQVSLAHLWRHWGIEPHAVLGQSLGEVAAAHVAGGLSLLDAAAVVLARSRCLERIDGTGATAVVELPLPDAAEEAARHGLSVAGQLAPGTTAVSGPRTAVERLVGALHGRDVFARVVPGMDFASHGPEVSPLRAELTAMLQDIQPVTGRIRFVSGHRGSPVDTACLDAAYWGDNLAEPFRFADGVVALRDSGHLHFVEVSGHPALLRAVESSAAPTEVAALASLRRGEDDRAVLLDALGALHCADAPVRWDRIFPAGSRVSLPTYPWRRERAWLHGEPVRRQRATAAPGGASVADAADRGAAVPAPGLPTAACQAAPVTVPGDRVAERLTEVWVEVLNVEPARVGPDVSFFDLGGESLKAFTMVRRISELFGVRIPPDAVTELVTIRQIADFIRERTGPPAPQPTPNRRATPVGAPEAVERPAAVEPATPGSTTGATAESRPAPSGASAGHEPFPLTDIQAAYWVGRSDALPLGQVATHYYGEFDTEGLDLSRLEAAWNLLVRRHPMLRATIRPDGRQQVRAEVEPYRFEVGDLRGLSPQVRQARSEQLREELSHAVHPSDTWPLFAIKASRLDERTTRLHLSFDFLILDGHSLGVLSQEWQRLYRDPNTPLAPLTLTFRDFVAQRAAERELARGQESDRYWTDRVVDLPLPPNLPILLDATRDREKPRFVRRSGRLGASAFEAIRVRSAEAGLTVSSVIQAAYADVLATFSTEARFTLNITTFNERALNPQAAGVVGDFTSSVPLAVDGAAAETFTERARLLQKQLWRDLSHADVGAAGIAAKLTKHRVGEFPLGFPVVYTGMLNEDGDEPVAMSWLGAKRFAVSQTPQVILDLQVMRDGRDLVFDLDAVERVFRPGALDALFEALRALLERLADDRAAWRDRPQAQLPAEQATRRRAVNQTDQPVPNTTLHEPFLRQVEQRPDAPAVIRADGHAVSYREIDGVSAAVAERLLAEGVRPGSLVAVDMEKGWEQVAAAIGVLRAGAAFLPVDPHLPDDRHAMLLRQGRVSVRLAQPWLADRPVEAGMRTIVVTEGMRPTDALALPSVRPDDLAYVIFTSGSTGVPKGVMISHRSAVNTVLDVNQRFGVTSDDRVLGLSALNFDLAVYDIFGPLAVGGALVLPAEQQRVEPMHWAELVARHRVTVWNSVPALMRLFTEHVEHSGAEVPVGGLRLVMLSGDWIPLELPDRIRRWFPGAEVVSLGGATEAAIWSIYHRIGDVDPAWTSIPYGRPMANQRFHVLNEQLADCPDWLPGELFIGGVGVAEGYWQDPERTARSFVHHPRTYERLYRTFDLGRYLPDGTIEFLGRADLQVKIQGYRVELEEIEGALSGHPTVAAAAVVAVGPRDGNRHLVAHVVPRSGGDLDEPAVREFLAGRLPAYMVPSRFVRWDDLPLSGTGKIDRSRLAATPSSAAAPVEPVPATRPEPAVAPAVPGVPPAGPATSLADEVHALLRQGMHDAPLDDHRTLAQLGAASIDIMTIGNALLARFGRRPDMPSLFNRMTVAAIVAFYVGSDAPSPALAAEPTRAASPPAAVPAATLTGMAERQAYARSRPALRRFPDESTRFALDDTPAPPVPAASRRSVGAGPVARQDLVTMLGALRDTGSGGRPDFGYSSASSLYPVQVYLHVVADRASGVPAGAYYYDPVRHDLVRLDDTPNIDFTGKVPELFLADAQAAAFSIYFVLDVGAMAPMYGPRSRDLGLLETGEMGYRLELAAGTAIALTNVGNDIDFAATAAMFGLDSRHELMHALVGGASRMPEPEPGRVDTAPEPERAPAAGVVDTAAEPERAPSSRTEPEPGTAVELTNRYEPFPLLDMQEAIWVGRTGDYDLGDVSVHMYLEFEAAGIDPRRLAAAWRQLAETHDMLGAVVGPDGRQVVLREIPPYEIDVVDIAHLSAPDQEREITLAREEMSHQVMPADRWPLFDNRMFHLGDDRWRLLSSVDELLLDATSSNILLRDLHRAYHGMPARHLGVTFRDYVMWELEQKHQPRYAEARDYWLRRMDSLPSAPQLPLARQARELPQVRFRRHEVFVSFEDWQRFKDHAREAGVTPAAALCTAFALVLGQWSASSHFTLNLTLFDRWPIQEDINDVIGQFTRNLLLEVDQRGPGGTFAEYARRLQDQLWHDLERREFNGVEYQRALARHRGTANGGLMPVVFTSMLDLPGIRETGGWPDWLGDPVETITQTPQIWMEHGILAQDESPLHLYWDVVAELFPDGMMAEMFAQYSALVHRLLESPAAWTEPPPAMVAAGPAELAGTAGGHRADLPAEAAYAGFLAQADRAPQAPAVLTPTGALSYATLRRRSLALAGILAERGIGRGSAVVLLIDKGLEQPVAALAVVLTGAAVIPLDTSLPSLRVATLLSAAAPDLVLTTTATTARFELPAELAAVNVSTTDLDGAPAWEPTGVPAADDPAVVIFTSGSTGTPKGVTLAHASISHVVRYTNRRFDVGPADRAFGITGLHHDMSLYDMFGMLAAGAAVVYPDAERLREPDHWLDLLDEHRVTVWNSVPATMGMLLDEADSRRRTLPESLRLIFLGGDWIPLPMPRTLRDQLPQARIVSVGGPTETTVWNIMFEVEQPDPGWRSVPYGYPIDDAGYRILNEDLQDRPVWVPGELYATGPGLSPGYWRDPERTGAVFVADPVGGGRMYRTGDLGRRLPDGSIEFLGRNDDQVKINGNRVETGDVAAVLKAHPGVRDAVVVARTDRPVPQLVGYLVLGADPRPDIADISTHLRERLPSHMVPAALVPLDEFPLTANGKVDRRALPDPEQAAPPSGGSSFTAPDSDGERRIAALLCGLLERESIGRNDNFFDLGATSIHLVRLRRMLAEEFGREVPVAEILQRPTLAQLAQAFGAPAAGGGPGDPGGKSRNVLTAAKQRADRRRRAR